MMRIVVALISFFFCSNSVAQNLIANGSFESYSQCPGSFTKTNEWFRAHQWLHNNQGTPDLFNSCSSGEAGVPHNWAGVAPAFDGAGYAGIYLWLEYRNYREYLSCELLQPLVKDTTYVLEFRYRLSSYSQYSADRIGAAISETLLKAPHDELLTAEKVSMIIQDTAMHEAVGTWESGRIEMKARGNERYLTIGNFHGNDLTKTYKLVSRTTTDEMLHTAAYYYIDDVSLRMKFERTVPEPYPVFAHNKIELNVNYVMRKVQFEFNSDKLLSSCFYQLDEVLEILRRHPELSIQLSGHTDDVGSEGFNMNLSRRRAGNVAAYLMSAGVDKQKIDVFGYGKTRPLMHGNTEEARSVNRRVEVRFIQ